MNKRRVLLTLLLAFVLSFVCAFAVACSDKPDDNKDVAVTSVTIDRESVELQLGVTPSVTLTATVAPENATNKAVTWGSDNTAVATVENGVVTAVGVGTATITATAGEKSDSCTVTVKAAPAHIAVNSVALSNQTLTLKMGDSESATLTVIFTPENATNKAVTWESDNTAVATVENGVVTAVAAGTANITVTSVDGGKVASCAVTVEAKTPETPDTPGPGDDTPVSHKIFLAGDSTVKTYEDNQYIGGWGQYLSEFLGEDLTVVNCAQGGRSSRSFINEGRLYDIPGCNYSFTQNNGNSIGDDISAGDYLFIQFGHNDDDTKMVSSAASNYVTVYDRMVPLGTPVDGIYPTTPATKVSTTTLPALYTQYATEAEETKALAETAKYGSEYYSYESGGTYKWYLKQYIDFAREKGAVPVLVTPVARVKFSGSEIIGGPGLHGDNFAYVQAVRQLAQEEDCLLIDLFAETKTILETSTSTYANYLMALKPNDLTGSWPFGYDTAYGNVSLGYTGIEATHYNKYGAFITAAKVAENIISMKDEKHKDGKEYFDFVSLVGNPKTYVDPSNLMPKSTVAAVEGLFSTIDVTNPNRQYPDPAEVVNMITAISAKTVTQENYLQIGEECEAARAAYNNLNVDDRPAVTNYNDLVTAETAVAEFVEANRVKPTKVIRFDASSMTTAVMDAATSCAGIVDVGEDATPTQFTVVAAAGKTVEVRAGEISFSYAGKDYSVSKYLSMGGSASFGTGRYIEFTVEGACTVTVVAKSTGSSDRVLKLVDSTNADVTTFAANASQSITSQQLSAAGTYRLGSAGSGIYVYAIIIEYFDGESPETPEHTHTADSQWHTNETNHWHECTAGDGEQMNMGEHEYTDEQDTDCNVCGYVRSITSETPGTGEGTSTPLPAGSKIYVVGDSTVCSFSDNYYLPRYGYGTQLAEYLNVTEAQIVNLALSGRSSKSFLVEENYATLVNSISAGDYLIIGFGHNDEKSAEPARFTDPNGTKDVENTAKGTSLKWCLYEKYIKVATDKGATPILCTPIVRYSSTADYSGSKAHITEDGNYPAAIKALGEETGTAVIDLTALTKELYESDNANAIYYHAHTSYAGAVKTAPYDGTETPDGRDDTHINKFGAKMVAYQFANALKATDCSLKAHVKDGIAAPTKAAEYVGAINQSYVKPDYTPFDPEANAANKIASTTTGTTTVDWYKTAMGTLGGATKVSQYVTTYADGKFSLTAGNGSKFAGSQDGFGAAFVQISKNDNFTASAHVKVNTVGDVKQSGFGLMLRDDILIDVNDATLATNYVAAGLKTNNGTINAIWSRTSSAALTTESKTTTCVAGQEYDVSITRTGQTVVVTFADGTNTFTKTYTDFDFIARDNEYMYLCLFANRSFAVEFTNVQFEITGTSQGA